MQKQVNCIIGILKNKNYHAKIYNLICIEQPKHAIEAQIAQAHIYLALPIKKKCFSRFIRLELVFTGSIFFNLTENI